MIFMDIERKLQICGAKSAQNFFKSKFRHSKIKPGLCRSAGANVCLSINLVNSVKRFHSEGHAHSLNSICAGGFYAISSPSQFHGLIYTGTFSVLNSENREWSNKKAHNIGTSISSM